jgi:hypothetical protein
MGLDTKTYWLRVRQSQCDFDLTLTCCVRVFRREVRCLAIHVTIFSKISICAAYFLFKIFIIIYIFYCMFKFLITIVYTSYTIFSVLGYTAYLTRNISLYKQQVESGFMLLMQYPGRVSPRRNFPYPSTRNLPHPHTIKVAAKGLVGSVFTCSCWQCNTIQPIRHFTYLLPKSPWGSLRFFIWGWGPFTLAVTSL